MTHISSNKLTRRRFGQVAAAGAGLGLSTLSARDALAFQDEPGWIDAHVHVWTPDIESYPIDDSYKLEDMQPRSFTPEELFAHCQRSGVDRVVLIQMSFYKYDNSYMTDMMAKHPGVFSGVAVVDHHDDDVTETIRELREQGVRGLRIHGLADEVAKWVDDPRMHRLWRAAREMDIAVCPLINPTDIEHVDTLRRRFEGTRVVVDHFARIGVNGRINERDVDNLCRLSRFDEVYIKTSAFYALGEKAEPYDDLTPMIKKVVDSFGPERLMWASDCPYQVQGDHSYDASIGLLRDRVDFLSDSDRQAILRDTAEKVFFG